MADAFRSGFVAIVGRTNVGKSTLMNRLIGQKIAITCNKPQTTRTRIRTILTEDRGQIIFVDTPGIHKAKTKLGEYMVGVAERTLTESDLILYLIEPSEYIGPGDRHILDLLKASRNGAGDDMSEQNSAKNNSSENATPVVLVINKIDTVKKEELAKIIAMYSSELDFDEVVPVSALNGENEEELKDVIFKLLPEGPMYYDEDELTDQPERQIAAELIRESALKALSDEIPHGIAVGIESMKERPGRGNNNAGSGFFDIEATIVCERESHKGIIIGKKGAMLKKIGTNARLQIEALLGYRVNLQLFVKVKKDWRDSDFLLKNYGFTDSDEE
ncbi:MAG: GTPase Era [Lachnospiraceae bacterium]|nr:GTPase Era [Lachnospiraceae bacterium]